MGSSVSSERTSGPYTTEVDGRTVKCDSLSDALALKVAELTAAAGGIGPAENLKPQQLIAVARKYGFDAIADKIEKL
ncbi:hypothetical protein [Lacipirellula sp.]|uniref:hypothetical protein n=1 Tax=Lacipirellula sp. TaxID=2691419 RepID=UPI003D097A8A